MGRGGDATPRPFRSELERWQHVGGGLDRDGKPIQEPWIVVRSRMIDSLCQRYSCLPSQLMEEDMALIFEMLNVLALVGESDGKGPNRTPDMEDELANLSRMQYGK